VDSTLVKALARAFRWQRMLESEEYGSVAELAAMERINASFVARVLRMTLPFADAVSLRWAQQRFHLGGLDLRQNSDVDERTVSELEIARPGLKQSKADGGAAGPTRKRSPSGSAGPRSPMCEPVRRRLDRRCCRSRMSPLEPSDVPKPPLTLGVPIFADARDQQFPAESQPSRRCPAALTLIIDTAAPRPSGNRASCSPVHTSEG